MTEFFLSREPKAVVVPIYKKKCDICERTFKSNKAIAAHKSHVHHIRGKNYEYQKNWAANKKAQKAKEVLDGTI